MHIQHGTDKKYVVAGSPHTPLQEIHLDGIWKQKGMSNNYFWTMYTTKTRAFSSKASCMFLSVMFSYQALSICVGVFFQG